MRERSEMRLLGALGAWAAVIALAAFLYSHRKDDPHGEEWLFVGIGLTIVTSLLLLLFITHLVVEHTVPNRSKVLIKRRAGETWGKLQTESILLTIDCEKWIVDTEKGLFLTVHLLLYNFTDERQSIPELIFRSGAFRREWPFRFRAKSHINPHKRVRLKATIRLARRLTGGIPSYHISLGARSLYRPPIEKADAFRREPALSDIDRFDLKNVWAHQLALWRDLRHRVSLNYQLGDRLAEFRQLIDWTLAFARDCLGRSFVSEIETGNYNLPLLNQINEKIATLEGFEKQLEQ